MLHGPPVFNPPARSCMITFAFLELRNNHILDFQRIVTIAPKPICWQFMNFRTGQSIATINYFAVGK